MNNSKDIKLAVLLMLVAALSRFIPHVPNFTPTEGMTLLGTAYLGRKYWAILLPVLMLIVSDFILNNTVARSYFPDHEGIVWFAPYMIFNILSIIAIVLICSKVLHKISFTSVTGAALIASVVFFLITNFGSWIDGVIPYSKDVSGLLASYTAALPFFRTSLLSNLIFTGILFGSFEIIKSIETKRSSAVSKN
ncbi:MAG: hypothetical protein IPO92_09925 [Saprospiraceae bacterium]|nr:hypothetical protein [Saprospiraceae bacterium]